MAYSIAFPVLSTLMTPSRKYSYQFSLRVAAVSAILLFTVIFLLPSQSGSVAVGLTASSSSYKGGRSVQQRKMVLGSRPPGCVNKCMNCQPCRATLVIPPHQNRAFGKPAHREDDTYYLLSWKCRCGNKLFQP